MIQPPRQCSSEMLPKFRHLNVTLNLRLPLEVQNGIKNKNMLISKMRNGLALLIFKMKNVLLCIYLIATIAPSFTGKVSAQTMVNLDGAGYVNLTPGSTWSPTAISGKTFLWWPSQGALKFGDFTTATSQSIANIGLDSIAGGQNAFASGAHAIAMGSFSNATQTNDLALGRAAHAIGGASTAIGTSANATGLSSIAVGGYANGNSSVSIGSTSRANGAASVALGYLADSLGSYSVAIGLSTANAYGEVAVGLFNLGLKKDGSLPTEPTNSASIDGSDPIFEIGNGSGMDTGAPTFSNALTVFRDGTVRLSKASGGISMGQFN